MKILGLVSSPHKEWGSTGKLVTAMLAEAKGLGAQTELVYLADLDIKYCLAARQCHVKGRCIIDDDAWPVVEKMEGADGIILSSPVYCGQLTGQMKTLMDRSSKFFHCHTLEGKYGASLSAAASSEAEEVADFLDFFLIHCGAQTVGKLPCLARDGKFPDETAAMNQARKLAGELVAGIRERRDYPEQKERIAKHRESMIQLVSRRKDEFAYEFDYIKRKGWI